MQSLDRLNLTAPSTLEEIIMLQRLAYCEPLTGLFNKRSFDRVLPDIKPGAVVMFIDVDNLKKINTELGHLAADGILKLIANVLVDSCHRASDMAFRWGGDEFAVVLGGCTLEYALSVANAISLGVCFIPASVMCSVSIGFARHLIDRSPLATLQVADSMTERAKQSGKNCVRYEN
jgi:diguanylate cyclase (GGDEF)-like protein